MSNNMRMWMLAGVFGMLSTTAIAQNNPVFVPGGELAERINLVHDRFDKVLEPAFTDAFILADVILDPAYPRRFSEFSGDISGRFIGALAMMSRGGADDERLHRLMKSILQHQRADGRFGNNSLSFAAKDVGPDQMALLWGNGRMLVGLLEYYQRFQEKEVLEASVRLGDFLLQVFDDCAKPEVMERVRGKAANGFICFTQFNEGLEMLARATGQEKYRDTARKMEPLLEPRGDQHTHGYLTTLRGHMMIHESTGEKALLDAVVARYKDMVDSGAVLINGGVLEYFKKGYDRDEGCSEADLLRLSLQLWKATGEEQYLERAEKCLYNIFYANQFITGDFGHHAYDGRGYITVPGPGRAWWCCTMHGLRAMRDVLDCVVTPVAAKNVDGALRINLYQEGRYQQGNWALRVERLNTLEGKPGLSYKIVVEAAPAKTGPFQIRVPEWSGSVKFILRSGGKETGRAEATREDKQLAWRECKSGDEMECQPDYSLRFLGRDGKLTGMDEFVAGEPKEVAVFYGPWLMGIDAAQDTMFHGEPFDNNLILLPEEAKMKESVVFGEAPAKSLQDGPHLPISYVHGGFSDPCTATLHPISEMTCHEQATFSFWHQVKRTK